MNRRQLLTGAVATVAGTLAVRASAACEDHEVTAPVEPCPCTCLDPETGEFYDCWEDGAPITPEEPEPLVIPEPEPIQGRKQTYPQIEQLPNTGSGPAMRQRPFWEGYMVLGRPGALLITRYAPDESFDTGVDGVPVRKVWLDRGVYERRPDWVPDAENVLFMSPEDFYRLSMGGAVLLQGYVDFTDR